MPLYSFSAPGKTFLIGEYLALRGGPSILLATGPRFRLQVSMGAAPSPFHPASLAGGLWQKHSALLDKYTVHFEDPYQALGGFGGSTAEYLLLAALLREMQKNCDIGVADIQSIWQQYRAGTGNSGEIPSGADLVAQWAGQSVIFRENPWTVHACDWPFAEADFSIFHMRQKLATHQHLGQRLSIPTADLLKVAEAALAAYQKADFLSFVREFKTYRDILQREGWVAAHTRKWIVECEKHPAVKAVKGCGAMGADTLLILHSSQDTAEIRSWGQSLGLLYVASARDLTEGLKADTLPA